MYTIDITPNAWKKYLIGAPLSPSHIPVGSIKLVKARALKSPPDIPLGEIRVLQDDFNPGALIYNLTDNLYYQLNYNALTPLDQSSVIKVLTTARETVESKVNAIADARVNDGFVAASKLPPDTSPPVKRMGRPPSVINAPGDALKCRTANLSQSTVDKLAAFGGGNLSAGIRLLVDKYLP